VVLLTPRGPVLELKGGRVPATKPVNRWPARIVEGDRTGEKPGAPIRGVILADLARELDHALPGRSRDEACYMH